LAFPTVGGNGAVLDKEAGARRWVEAVNNWSELGQWEYLVIKDLTQVESELGKLLEPVSV
jgi:hypothetical protein